MKKEILIAIISALVIGALAVVFLCVPAKAQDSTSSNEYTGNRPQPRYLKDARIHVKLKSGRIYQFDANKYKVVTRESSRRFANILDSLYSQIRNCQAEFDGCNQNVYEMDKRIAELVMEVDHLKKNLKDKTYDLEAAREALRQTQNDLLKAEQSLAVSQKNLESSQNELHSSQDDLQASRKSLEEKVIPPNRITIHAGAGPDGVAVKEQDNVVRVTTRTSALVGASYARRIYDDWSAQGTMVIGTSPESRTVTALLGLGYDF